MKRFILTAAAVLCASAAFAQSPAPMPHTRASAPGKMPPVMLSQQVIGNKKTHVYHFATDKSLPSPVNLVTFPSVSAAIAAGYHAPGKGPKVVRPKMMPHAMARPVPGVMPHSMPSAPPPHAP